MAPSQAIDAIPGGRIELSSTFEAEQLTVEAAVEIFEQWLSDFVAAVQTGSATDLEELFIEEATWRDFMAFPWDFHHTIGRAETVERLIELAGVWEAEGFRPSQEQTP